MKIKKANLVIILLSLIGIIGYVSYTAKGDFFKIFQQARDRWIVVGICLMVLYWLLESIILHLVTCKLHPKQKLRSSVQTTMIGQFFNCITPFASGGQPMQAIHMMKTGVPFGLASSCLLVKFIVYQLVLTVYSLVVLCFKLKEFSSMVNGFTYMVLIGFGVNTVVVIGLICIGCFRKGTVTLTYKVIDILGRLKWIKEVDKKKTCVLKEFDSFYESFRWMGKNKTVIFYMMFLSAVQLTVYFLIPYCIYLAFNLHGELTSIISAQAFVLMISSFVPLPGGAGGAEISFLAFFRLFFPANLLNVSILIWRMITFYLTICVGLCFTLWKKDKKSIKKQLKVNVGLKKYKSITKKA